MVRQKGFTLLELMVALAVGSLLFLGLGLLFSQNKRSFYNNEDIARLQEDGRYALEELNIKRSTVDKLTGSYAALEQHAHRGGEPRCAADAVAAVGVQDQRRAAVELHVFRLDDVDRHLRAVFGRRHLADDLDAVVACR